MYGRKQKEYFEGLMKKVTASVHSWKSKLLSFGGKYILVKHVLQSLPIYQLSVMNPPKGVIDFIQTVIAKFFWSSSEETKGNLWVAWDTLCLLQEEGGFRSLHHMVDALFANL